MLAAFDAMGVDGTNLRPLALLERKARLRALLPTKSSHVLDADYRLEKGQALFALARNNDLEGVVGKLTNGAYQSDGRLTSWVKVKNPNYSQAEGRAEFFDKRTRAKRAQAAERDPVRDRRRRDGRGLQGPRHPPRSHRRHQGPPA